MSAYCISISFFDDNPNGSYGVADHEFSSIDDAVDGIEKLSSGLGLARCRGSAIPDAWNGAVYRFDRSEVPHKKPFGTIRVFAKSEEWCCKAAIILAKKVLEIGRRIFPEIKFKDVVSE